MRTNFLFAAIAGAALLFTSLTPTAEAQRFRRGWGGGGYYGSAYTPYYGGYSGWSSPYYGSSYYATPYYGSSYYSTPYYSSYASPYYGGYGSSYYSTPYYSSYASPYYGGYGSSYYGGGYGGGNFVNTPWFSFGW